MIGIDISDRSVKIAQINNAQGPLLTSIGWFALNNSIMRRGIILDVAGATAAVARALQLCQPTPVQSGEVVVSIPETQSFVRVLELPVMNEQEVSEAVQWAIRQHIPFDLDRVYLDWQLLGQIRVGETTRQQVLVGAAQRSVVDPLLQVVDALKLQVVACELEAQAIVRSLLPRAAQDIQGIVLVDLGATATNVIFFDRGTIQFTTSLQQGGDDLTARLTQTLQLSVPAATEKKAAVGVEQPKTAEDTVAVQVMRDAALELVHKIEQVVAAARSQVVGEQAVQAILLAGGAANLPGLVNVFAEVFPGIPVQLGNPVINLLRDDSPQGSALLTPNDATHFTTAIGLALRN